MEKEFKKLADLVADSVSPIVIKDIFSPVQSNYR